MQNVLVIDLGGTKTSVSVINSIDSKVQILKSSTFKTISFPERAISEITSIYENLLRENIKANCMSLSLPGFWDKNGVLQESFFLENYIGYPLIHELASTLGIKEYTWESDVVCGALGEHNFGVGNGCDHSLLYINMGTGISAALIDKDGKLFKHTGASCSKTLRMQKLVFPYGDQLCSAVDLISGGMLLDFAQYDSIEELYTAYKEGDINAIDTISRAQTQLAAWLINLFYLFSPDVIVLNGGLTFDFEVLAEEAIEIANEELEGKVEIVQSKLREKAPIYGAYLNLSRSPGVQMSR